MNQPNLQPYFQQLELCMLKDRQGFSRRLLKLQKSGNTPDTEAALQKLASELEGSVEKAKLRLQQCPALH
ncbi:MAG: hypothetical protein OEZ15_04475, partial [Gammaproteobacteria bacterium]|nr:hypothetical protein [Gammaproteobacteria bacterium]